MEYDVGSGDMHDLAVRAERVQSLTDIALKMREVAGNTAERLYGPEPEESGDECTNDPKVRPIGSFSHMDQCLGDLETALRDVEREIVRLSRA